MLNLCVLGSGSYGNSIYIESETTKILIDAGFSCKKTCNRLEDIERDLSSLDALIVTHEHIDHCRGINVIAKKTGIPIYINEPTYGALNQKPIKTVDIVPFTTGASFVIKDLHIETFSIPHDAVDPVGIIVKSKGVKAAIITDLGYVTNLVRERVKDTDALIIESNHDPEMLTVGPYPWQLKQRIKSRLGHLSNEDCGTLLKDLNQSEKLKIVVLAHLSEKNNHPEIARITAQNILDKNININLSIANQHQTGKFFQMH